MGLSQYRKYGSAATKLKDAVKSGIVSHAYIIEGDNNIDKTGFAKAFCQALVCRQMPGEGCGRCIECRKINDGNYEDLYFVEPEDTTAKKTGTNTIKDAQIEELQVNLKNKPTAGDHNLAVISGGDTMTPRAQTRFLKTLEEPPAGTVIMILSENSEELLPTINSRCVNIRLYDINSKDNNEKKDAAKSVLSMMLNRTCFADVKDELDESIKSRQDAYAFLDAFESLIGSTVKGIEKYDITPEAARRSTELIESARRDIRGGASYGYMTRNLVLAVEDILYGQDA